MADFSSSSSADHSTTSVTFRFFGWTLSTAVKNKSFHVLLPIQSKHLLSRLFFIINFCLLAFCGTNSPEMNKITRNLLVLAYRQVIIVVLWVDKNWDTNFLFYITINIFLCWQHYRHHICTRARAHTPHRSAMTHKWVIPGQVN